VTSRLDRVFSSELTTPPEPAVNPTLIAHEEATAGGIRVCNDRDEIASPHKERLAACTFVPYPTVAARSAKLHAVVASGAVGIVAVFYCECVWKHDTERLREEDSRQRSNIWDA